MKTAGFRVFHLAAVTRYLSSSFCPPSMLASCCLVFWKDATFGSPCFKKPVVVGTGEVLARCCRYMLYEHSSPGSSRLSCATESLIDDGRDAVQLNTIFDLIPCV